MPVTRSQTQLGGQPLFAYKTDLQKERDHYGQNLKTQWLPQGQREDRNPKGFPSGAQNDRSKLNVVYQSLMHLPIFVRWVQSHIEEGCPVVDCTPCALCSIVREYWGPQNDQSFLINAHMPLTRIHNAAQAASALQDAYNFYEWITARVSMGDPTNMVSNDPRNPWDNELKALFQLDVNQQSECLSCGIPVSTLEQYGVIDAKFDMDAHANLDEILGTWFLADEGRQRCPTCTTVQDCEYFRTIKAAPQVLRIKVNLYRQMYGMLTKQAWPFTVPDRLDMTRFQENASLPLGYTLSSAIAHGGLGGADDAIWGMPSPSVSISNSGFDFGADEDEEEDNDEQAYNGEQDYDVQQGYNGEQDHNGQQGHNDDQDMEDEQGDEIDYQHFVNDIIEPQDDDDVFGGQHAMNWTEPPYDAGEYVWGDPMDHEDEEEEIDVILEFMAANRIERSPPYRGEPRNMRDPGGWPRRSESPRRRPNSPPRYTMGHFNGLVEVTREEFVRELGPGSSQPASEVDENEFYGYQDPLCRRGSASPDHSSSSSETDSQATISAPPSVSPPPSHDDAFDLSETDSQATITAPPSDESSSDDASSEESRGFWVADWRSGLPSMHAQAQNAPPPAPVPAQGPLQNAINYLNAFLANDNNNNNAAPPPPNNPPTQPNNNNNATPPPPNNPPAQPNNNNNAANIPPNNIIGEHWIVNTRGPTNSSHISDDHFQTLGPDELNANPQMPVAGEPCARDGGYQVYILTYTRDKLRGADRKKELNIPAFV